MKKNLILMVSLFSFSFMALTGNVFADAITCTGGSTPCGNVCVPNTLLNIVRTIVNVIKIGVPIILIILGMIDMGKAVASQKDEEIKKGQKTLMSRCIAAGIVFFVVAIVQLLVNIIDGGTESNATKCLNTIFNGTTSTDSGNNKKNPTNSSNKTNNKDPQPSLHP